MITDERLQEIIDDGLWMSESRVFTNDDVDILSAFKELITLRKENKELIAYADKLIEPLDYLPKDIENIRKANYRLHEVEAQNKELIEDSERLDSVIPYDDCGDKTCKICKARRQHKELMDKYRCRECRFPKEDGHSEFCSIGKDSTNG